MQVLRPSFIDEAAEHRPIRQRVLVSAVTTDIDVHAEPREVAHRPDDFGAHAAILRASTRVGASGLFRIRSQRSSAICNLYRASRSVEEIARLFRVESTIGNAAEEVYPKYSGLVIAEGRLRTMTWGFPREQISKKTGKLLKPTAVNNARSDQLVNPYGMWRDSFERRRCLIPLTAWAEAEGSSGSMTRTWLSLPDQPIFACAGIWRGSDEWGDCYSMVMTDAVGPAAEVHDRMPVILRPEDYDVWQHAAPDDARSLCVGYTGDLAIDRTSAPWRPR